ncbi:collagen triple helix repeat-containing protein 1-like [Dendronephthya gigantea]|uniref:collagen triple helix repeat-containing protein 1-like n=1 Tax=Dendronephthya gigantea TaxID=151771 RepID=UPI0010698DDE|nr:collagen triple helix repeat-containing protein 1-like [Dendronephthya gigantea]
MEKSHLTCLGVILLSLTLCTDASSTCSCSSGESSCQKEEKRTIRQCTYTNLRDDRNSGQIMTCDFRKTRSDTALRVTYQGDLRVISGNNVCRRWFLTINGRECQSPATIETQIHPIGVSGLNNHRPATVDGFCEGIKQGRIIVGLSVGSCKYGYESQAGDAYTCWGSVCRIIIEEVPPLQ